MWKIVISLSVPARGWSRNYITSSMSSQNTSYVVAIETITRTKLPMPTKYQQLGGCQKKLGFFYDFACYSKPICLCLQVWATTVDAVIVQRRVDKKKEVNRSIHFISLHSLQLSSDRGGSMSDKHVFVLKIVFYQDWNLPNDDWSHNLRHRLVSFC